jgi:hypothetical protein
MVRVVDLLTVPSEAVIVTELLPAEGLVVTVKVPEVLPARIVIEAGTVAMDVLLLVSMTVVPPTGAGPESVTVPVEEEPASTAVGDKVREVRAGGLTSKVVLIVTVPSDALIVAVTGPATGVVPMLKFADIDPERTVTDAGTEAQAWSLVRLIDVPVEGAGAFKATLPKAAAPPVTVVGEMLNELSAGGPLGGL